MRITFVWYVITLCIRPEVTSDVISGSNIVQVVVDVCVILAQTSLEIYVSEAVVGGIFDRFLNFDNCQSEVVSDVISSASVQYASMNVRANFGDSRLKSPEARYFRPLFERRQLSAGSR